MGMFKRTLMQRRHLREMLEALSPLPDVAWIMTPPAVPVFDVMRRWQKSRPSVRVVVDWHNLGHTRLTRRWGSWHPIAHCYRRAEFKAWPENTTHIAVSSELASHVRARLNDPEVHVLHDRNPSWRAFPQRDRAVFMEHWGRQLKGLDPNAIWIVHPHSWSDDECPEWILEILTRSQSLLPVQFVITGDGPLKGPFERRARAMGLKQDRLLLPFLPPNGYMALLANADWGLCPHTSSSGLDLPMKLADMRGARIPALVYDYGSVLREVFSAPGDGRFFDSFESLQTALGMIASGELVGAPPAEGPCWETEWNRIATPLLEK